MPGEQFPALKISEGLALEHVYMNRMNVALEWFRKPTFYYDSATYFICDASDLTSLSPSLFMRMMVVLLS